MSGAARWLLLVAGLWAAGCVAAAEPVLRYDRHAPDTVVGWEQHALPIGHGRLGAMLFGGVPGERIQLNDISLWSGDERVMEAY